jgi:hypothetical protein
MRTLTRDAATAGPGPGSDVRACIDRRERDCALDEGRGVT